MPLITAHHNDFQKKKEVILSIWALNKEDTVYYPTEFLNYLSVSGLPAYTLSLKVGVSIILMKH